jgi:hypothetical protein
MGLPLITPKERRKTLKRFSRLSDVPLTVEISGPSERSFMSHPYPKIVHMDATTAELMRFWMMPPAKPMRNINAILYHLYFPNRSIPRTPPNFCDEKEHASIMDLYSTVDNKRIFKELIDLQQALKETRLEDLETLSQRLQMRPPRYEKVNLGELESAWNGQIYVVNGNQEIGVLGRYFLT